MSRKIWPDIENPNIPGDPHMELRELLRKVSEKHGLQPWQLTSKRRFQEWVEARKDFIVQAASIEPNMSKIARFLDISPSTVRTHVKDYKDSYEAKTD